MCGGSSIVLLLLNISKQFNYYRVGSEERNMPRSEKPPVNNNDRYEEYDDGEQGPYEEPFMDVFHRRGVRLAMAGLGAFVAAGLVLSSCESGGFKETAGVKHGSKTNTKFVEWKNTSSILAAEGKFINTADAQVNVHMKADPPSLGILNINKIPFSGFVEDKIAPDYNEKFHIVCDGNLQEIIPVTAITQSHTSNGGILATVDMTKVVMNPYCESTAATVDPSTAQVFYDGYTVARDLVTKIGKLTHTMNDNTLPKPDVMLNNITDNSKNRLTIESLQSMKEVCAKPLASTINDSAKQGVEVMMTTLRDDLSKKNLTVETKGVPAWRAPTDKVMEKSTQKYMEFQPSLKKFTYDKASCDTTNMTIIGGDAKGSK